MSTQIMHPAELEARLEARMHDLQRSPRKAQAPRRRDASSSGRVRPKAAGVVAAVGVLMIAMVSTALGTTYIDLTTAGASGTTTDGVNSAVGDGVFIQGGLGSGTGTFNPFMTMSAGGSTPTEAGVNTCMDGPTVGGCHFNTYDTFYGGSRTKAIQVAGIPSISYAGELYRQFTLDSSETGSDDYMSLDQLKIFIDDQADLHEYDSGSEAFADNTGIAPVKVYDMGDTRVLMRTQTLTPGNGVSDITLLVKDSAFPSNCFYGSTTCNRWLYFWNAAGGVGTGLDDGIDYNVGAGFEEWRVSLQPVVNVTKTAVPTFDRTYDWSVLKTVDPSTLDLFNGDSSDVTWSVTPTRGAAQDSNWKVTGTITIANPTGSGPIPQDIDATVNSITDVIDGTINVNTLGTVTCPSFPATLKAGESLECTYSYTYGSAPAAGSHTNVATANIDISDTATHDYSGSAPFDFADATPTVTDATATLTDSNGHTFASSITGAMSGTAITYDQTFTCSTDQGTHSNTATLVESDSGTNRTSTATATVNCYALTVTKDALPTLDRSYDWTILKTADPTTLNLFNGDSGSTTWTIAVTRSAPVDSGWGVHGTITIQNPAPMIATGVSVSDVLTGSLSATVDCDAVTAGNQTTVDVPAKVGSVNGQATCSYTKTGLPDGTTRTNTATATLFSQDYTGTASVNFASATVTEIDQSAIVNDGNAVHTTISGNATYTWNEEFECGSTRQESNTASVTVVDDANDTGETHSSTANVQVNCYGLTVSKDATTTFTRDYNWQISKERFIATGEIDGDSDPSTLTLEPNQTYTASYHVTVALASIPYVDSDWGVHGTITIQNPAPMQATGVSVTDLITESGESDIAGTVDCDSGTAGNQTTVNIPAKSGSVNGQATCSYSASLPNADTRTNTATATLFSQDYTGTASVAFGTPTSLVDECVDVTDNNGTPSDTSDDVALGQVCVADAPHTFTFTLDIGPFAVCGAYTFTNRATYLAVDDTNDTGETNFATYTVNIDVPCPEGCTLTQGYWKTHNDTFWGGAPSDATWDLLGDVDGDSIIEGEGENFFLSGQTFFDVMWTSGKGNAYYILAKQYIAAWLNTLAGADDSAISAVFADATTLFQTYTPSYIGGLKGKNAIRQNFLTDAGILGQYNEGLIGPGHCDDDGQFGSFANATLTSTTLQVADVRRSGLRLA